jgi:hypothetical protein
MEASLRPQPVVFDSFKRQPKPSEPVLVNSPFGHAGFERLADEGRGFIDSLTLTHRRDIFPIDS